MLIQLLSLFIILTGNPVLAQNRKALPCQGYTLVRWAGKSNKEIKLINKKISKVKSIPEMEKIFLREPGYLKTSVLVMITEKKIIYPWFGTIEGVKKKSNQNKVTLRGKSAFPTQVSSQAELLNLFSGTLLLLDSITINVNRMKNVNMSGFYLVSSNAADQDTSKTFLNCRSGNLTISVRDLQKIKMQSKDLQLYNTESGEILLGNFQIQEMGPKLKDCIEASYNYYRTTGYEHHESLIPLLRYLNIEYGKISPDGLDVWIKGNRGK